MTIEGVNGPCCLEAGENPARPRHCERRRAFVAFRAEPTSSTHVHWRASAGKESEVVSSQETGPFIPATNPLEGGVRGRLQPVSLRFSRLTQPRPRSRRPGRDLCLYERVVEAFR